MPSFRVSAKVIEDAMRSSETRAALKSHAEKIAARANSLGAAEGVDMNASVAEGTRPKGRPYANAESDNVAQEWGNRETERRRIMGRAAGL